MGKERNMNKFGCAVDGDVVDDEAGDGFEFNGRGLVERDNIRVYESKKDPTSHDVIVDSFYLCLPHGVLEDMAMASRSELESKYRALRGVSYEIEIPDVPIERFGWALARALVVKMRDERDYFIGEVNKLRGL